MSEPIQIIKRCIKRDREAQQILYDTYAPVLLGLCRRYTLDLPEAEDILQEGFVKIFLNLKNYRGQGTLLNWMKKVMINTAITYYHRHYNHRYHYEIEESQAVGQPSRREPVGTQETCPECGHELVVQIGKTGPRVICRHDGCDYERTIRKGEKVQTCVTCSRCGKPLVVRFGKRGAFLGCSGYPGCRWTEAIA